MSVLGLRRGGVIWILNFLFSWILSHHTFVLGFFLICFISFLWGVTLPFFISYKNENSLVVIYVKMLLVEGMQVSGQDAKFIYHTQCGFYFMYQSSSLFHSVISIGVNIEV